MRNRELVAKFGDLEARITTIETALLRDRQDLHRDLAALEHKINQQSRALDRLLRYAAESTGLDPLGDETTVTWSD